jgi:glycosyltransferase involved in cell wall biosynthesis
MRYGVAERLIARPAVDPRVDLAPYYHSADVCVQASRAEGLGFSPLEALACGTPVVAAHVGGLQETIIDGVSGWTYAAGDANSLASALECALDDLKGGVHLGRNGRKLVEDGYERSRVIQQFAKLLGEAVDCG